MSGNAFITIKLLFFFNQNSPSFTTKIYHPIKVFNFSYFGKLIRSFKRSPLCITDVMWSLVVFIYVAVYHVHFFEPGAIIRDGDRKRAPFLVLGLAPWYGTIFLFLEQIAPSPAAHARTCCEDFLRMSRRGNGIQDSRNLCFWSKTQHVYVCWNLAQVFSS